MYVGVDRQWQDRRCSPATIGAAGSGPQGTRRISPFLIQQIANGIMVGSIYALIAMGVAMIYGVMNVPDFALGAKAMLGGYVAFFFTATFHQAYGVALVGSIVVLACSAWASSAGSSGQLPMPARSTASSRRSACCWCSRISR